MNTYAKQSYRGCCCGESEKGPYVYHAEAYSINPALRPTKSTEGKDYTRYSFMAAIDRNPFSLISDDCGAKHPDAKNIVMVTMAERFARRLQGVDMSGRKYALCGTPRLFHNKDGDQVVLCADNIYPISCYKGEGIDEYGRISHSKYIFQQNDGSVGIAHTATLLNCMVLSMEEFKTELGETKIEFLAELGIPALKAEAIVNETITSGMLFPNDKVVKFSVRGKKAEDMRKILIPGNILLITGRLFATPDDDVSVGGVVREVSIAKWVTKKGAE